MVIDLSWDWEGGYGEKQHGQLLWARAGDQPGQANELQHATRESGIRLGHRIIVGPNTTTTTGLRELAEMCYVLLTGEALGIVREVLLGKHAKILTQKLKLLFGLESVMGGKRGLMFNMNEGTGVIHKDGSSLVHV